MNIHPKNDKGNVVLKELLAAGANMNHKDKVLYIRILAYYWVEENSILYCFSFFQDTDDPFINFFFYSYKVFFLFLP